MQLAASGEREDELTLAVFAGISHSVQQHARILKKLTPFSCQMP